MDETTRQHLIELAEQHGLDPEQLLGIVSVNDLPEELQEAMAAILGDITLFGQALKNMDT